MRTKKFDPNEEYAYREKRCKNGVIPGLCAYLPINRPPFYKRRVAELYARHKMYPVNISAQRCFPEFGPCIVFIPFIYGLLGKYDLVTSRKEKEFYFKMIHEKALRRN